MTNWVWRGLLRGRQSTRYPARSETAEGVSPGRPVATPMSAGEAGACASVCPTGALVQGARGIDVDYRRCVHCLRCLRSGTPAAWDGSYEWGAVASGERGQATRQFKRSLHVRFIDSGACGACMGEAGLLDSPRYNFHRLGIFFTPSPRKADVLLVAGPVTENMRAALVATYEAMPEPKIVVAMGVCAIDGGVFGRTFAVCGGAEAAVPVDVFIPGCPPPPLALIHGLLVATGRAQPSPVPSELTTP
jgi:Ni,Fe-hydrogenase III small subunit